MDAIDAEAAIDPTAADIHAMDAVSRQPADVLALEPTGVPEWDAEDLANGDLSDETAVISASEAREMFDDVLLQFPAAVTANNLVDYAAARATPLDQPIMADASSHDYVLMELPVNILIPPNRKLTRLRLTVTATCADAGSEPVVAYDLFPTDTWHPVTHDIGSLSVDVTKALTFLSPLVGDVLGLKLSVPLKWTSTYVSIRCSDRMSNPAQWYITDDTIEHGFSGYVIWRAPKGSSVVVAASLVGELRKHSGLGLFSKAQFRTATKTYTLSS